MTHTPELVALLYGQRVATIRTLASGRHELEYETSWMESQDSHPLSLSMPLAASRHPHKAVNAFLWGLLPDNTETLKRYARRFSVSENNAAALLTHLGADCPGALQLVPPERVDEFRDGSSEIEAEWMSEGDIEAELTALRQTGLPLEHQDHGGQFSLAGAQPKIALLRHEGRWGRPSGRTPTTHILKPPASEYPRFAENEHLCLQIARALELPAARSSVARFRNEHAIVVERYDRRFENGTYTRIHQEDLCQALNVHPENKYENQGGPGLKEIFRLLSQASLEPATDRRVLLDAIILNWIFAATDAHAKNFSLIHHAGGGVRLAPLYDVISFLPYASGSELHDVKLAMRIHNEYEVRRITARDWLRFAKSVGCAEDEVVGRLRDLLRRTPDATREAARRAIEDGLDAAWIESFASKIVAHADRCAKWIETGLSAST